MKETEEDLEDFFRHWQAKTDNVIIQKYDHFSGRLPERKVTDLSPLKRLACWHMKRDFHILLNGDVPLCREDISSEHLLGNIFKDPIAGIWNNGEAYYRDHLQGDYPEICKKCDEYYTYNF